MTLQACSAFDNLALWDPEANTDIEQGLDDLFQGRDWTKFVSREDLRLPDVSTSNAELVFQEEGWWLLKFDYVNEQSVAVRWSTCGYRPVGCTSFGTVGVLCGLRFRHSSAANLAEFTTPCKRRWRRWSRDQPTFVRHCW